jgi:chemotaxis protein MotB
LKKKHPEHVNLERWLVSYADFITLLFAFFVVMYAMANQDKAKVKQIVESIEKSFMGPSSKLDAGTGEKINLMTNPTSILGRVIDQPAGYTNAVPTQNPELDEITKRIEESLNYQMQTTDLKDTLQLVYDDRGLVIRFSANKLFDPGDEAVKPEFRPLITKIGKVVSASNRLIRVEGHTDSNPPNNPKFPTNWELSAARASWIVRFMKAQHKIPTKRLSAAGYADGQPLASNKTTEGQAKNRRVEIVVTNIKDLGE